MANNLFYIKNTHKINTIRLKAFVLGLETIKKEEISYENCKLTDLINQKLTGLPENMGALLQLNYTHKEFHANAEKIIGLKGKKNEETSKLIAKLESNSDYIINKISELLQ